MLLDLAYVGTTGTKLPRFVQIDQAYITKQQIDTLTPTVVARMELIGIPPGAANFLYDNQLWGVMSSIVRTPYFGFAQLFQAEDAVSSNYHSLQAKLDKRFSNGLSFLASYTWSHSIDGASVFFGSGANATTIFPQDNYNLAAERANSDFAIRQRLSSSFTYELPVLQSLPKLIGEGWQVGGILTLQTRRPVSVLTGNGLSGTGLGNDWPHVVGHT